MIWIRVSPPPPPSPFTKPGAGNSSVTRTTRLLACASSLFFLRSLWMQVALPGAGMPPFPFAESRARRVSTGKLPRAGRSNMSLTPRCKTSCFRRWAVFFSRFSRGVGGEAYCCILQVWYCCCRCVRRWMVASIAVGVRWDRWLSSVVCANSSCYISSVLRCVESVLQGSFAVAPAILRIHISYRKKLLC